MGAGPVIRLAGQGRVACLHLTGRAVQPIAELGVDSPSLVELLFRVCILALGKGNVPQRGIGICHSAPVIERLGQFQAFPVIALGRVVLLKMGADRGHPVSVVTLQIGILAQLAGGVRLGGKGPRPLHLPQSNTDFGLIAQPGGDPPLRPGPAIGVLAAAKASRLAA